MTRLGDRVKIARDHRKLSQVKLAKKISELFKEKVDQQSISQLENGDVSNPAYLPELLEALQISRKWLRFGEGEMEAQASGAAPVYKEDRQDIHEEIEALPAGRMDEVRLAIEIVKSRIPRKPAPVIPMNTSRKEKQKK